MPIPKNKDRKSCAAGCAACGAAGIAAGIGRRIRERRNALCLSVAGLAGELGIPSADVEALENGETIGGGALGLILNRLGLSRFYILTGISEEEIRGMTSELEKHIGLLGILRSIPESRRGILENMLKEAL
ncbi:MAG: hypothetical protein LBO78_01135 [Rickettsiales bacterium]|jgi:transcriptional regulator with XRE-family HTH domain|nr:hypothetical protein [Rickettsiales bacterium]